MDRLKAYVLLTFFSVREMHLNSVGLIGLIGSWVRDVKIVIHPEIANMAFQTDLLPQPPIKTIWKIL